MAKRKNKTKEALAREREEALLRHLDALNCPDVGDYFDWCRGNGFAASLNKGPLNLRREIAFYRKQISVERLRGARSLRAPAAVLDRVCAGKLNVDDIGSITLREIAHRFEVSETRGCDRQSLRDFLAFVDADTGLLTETDIAADRTIYYLDGLIALHRFRHEWIRPLREWRARTHNRYRQFSSLLRHLLTRYSVPAFFDSVWFRTDRRSERLRQWFVHIGQGGSPRCGPAPVPLTKRTAHFFLQAPDACSIEQAVRWGQIHALGGSVRLCEAVIGSRLGRTLANDDFWRGVLGFFVRHPSLDRTQIGPIVDYLHRQKFVHERFVMPDGSTRHEPPPQPNLSMRGRSPDALLRQVEAWHRLLGKIEADGSLRWKPSGIEGFALRTCKGDKRMIWRVTELLCHKELVREGQAMKHCVAAYASWCKAGDVSIWSMTTEDVSGRLRRRQTVEVDRHKTIIQCRGHRNELPGSPERRVLALWAKQSSLTIASYV